MRATLQWEGLKALLKQQHGVPDSIVDQVDNILRLQYKEGYDDAEEDAKYKVNSEDEEGQ